MPLSLWRGRMKAPRTPSWPPVVTGCWAAQTPSDAPVTGLSSYWKPWKTCTEYCNLLPMHSIPPGGIEEDHWNSRFRFRMEGIQILGKPHTAVGAPVWWRGMLIPLLWVNAGHREGERQHLVCGGQLFLYGCWMPVFLPRRSQCCFPSRCRLAVISMLLQINQEHYWQLPWRLAWMASLVIPWGGGHRSGGPSSAVSCS